MLTTRLDMFVGNNSMVIYKIDTGSERNIMPWYIFKKLFPRVTESQLIKTVRNHIKFKMYNKTVITKLRSCDIIISYKINGRKCEFFVVPGNGQELLDMPDTAALNIINVNNDSIGAEAEGTQRENYNTNISNANSSNAKQETHGAKECYTNTIINYFLSSPNIEIDQKKKH